MTAPREPARAGAARLAIVLALRHALRLACLPALLATAVALLAPSLLAASDPGLLDDDSAAAAGAFWLHLPVFTAAATSACAVVAFWPAFARERPAADWVVRLQRSPLSGCGAATAGALLAQLLLTLPIAAMLPRALGAPADARSHLPLAAAAEPVLAGATGRLALTLPAPTAIAELHLRPVAMLPEGPFQPTRVQVVADGAPLPHEELAFAQTHQLQQIAFAARTVREIELVRTGGTVPLFFPPGTAVAVAAAGHDARANGLLLAIALLVPTFAALGVANLCAPIAGLPTIFTVLFVLLFVQAIGGAGPTNAAVAHVLRGHWLPDTGVFADCIPSLAAGAIAMIVAMLLRRPRRVRTPG